MKKKRDCLRANVEFGSVILHARALIMGNKPTHLNLLYFFLPLVIRSTTVHGRPITTRPPLSDAISDGVHDQVRGSPPFMLQFFAAESCTQTYGFVPCTTTVFGNLFLIFVYGYLMYDAAGYLSTGSELLLKILGPESAGIVGGLILPILGAVPDAALILASGLSGSTEAAEGQVSIGMGLLAGLTIAVLTIIWGSCVVAGKCDLDENSIAKDNTDKNGFSLTGSGVSTSTDGHQDGHPDDHHHPHDHSTNTIAQIMAVSTVPFIIVQIPQVFHSTLGRQLAVLIAFIFSLLLFLSYSLYQICHKEGKNIPHRRLAYTMHKDGLSRFLDFWRSRLDDGGQPNKDAITMLFTILDKNKDGQLSVDELKGVLKEIWFDEIDWDVNDAAEKLMKYFGTSEDNNQISEDKFVKGISKWQKQQREKKNKNKEKLGTKSTNKAISSSFEGQSGNENDDDDKEGVVNEPFYRRAMVKAALRLVWGTIIAVLFANPLVDAIDNLSSATTIPPFFISFVVLPLATNLSEAVSIIITAGKKTTTTASFSFSEIYGTVIVNNLLCLTVMSGLVYFRGLTWDFSAEVVTTILVCLVVSAFASFRTTYPLWTALVTFLLYPLSMALIYVLQYVAGWT
ncbi:hypothetical protein L1049_025344 [Liquidambar formosana]|uniref:EF-hand domain-containing protein n=1 Tax=Liquidambar formosana TaxID=63359 RepID=A0AAP0N3S9_LIQFO